MLAIYVGDPRATYSTNSVLATNIAARTTGDQSPARRIRKRKLAEIILGAHINSYFLVNKLTSVTACEFIILSKRRFQLF